MTPSEETRGEADCPGSDCGICHVCQGAHRTDEHPPSCEEQLAALKASLAPSEETRGEKRTRRVQAEPWDSGDYVVTIDGKPVGQARSRKEIDVIAQWLLYAQHEVSAAFSRDAEVEALTTERDEAQKALKALHTPGCEHFLTVVANCCEGNDRFLAGIAAPLRTSRDTLREALEEAESHMACWCVGGHRDANVERCPLSRVRTALGGSNE